jgi:hypothetical protein
MYETVINFSLTGMNRTTFLDKKPAVNLAGHAFRKYPSVTWVEVHNKRTGALVLMFDKNIDRERWVLDGKTIGLKNVTVK